MSHGQILQASPQPAGRMQVILGLGWSYQCDIWSAGCIIVELITGRALFQTHENLEHLAMMERVLDRIPSDLARRASSDARKYFSKDDALLWGSSASRKSIKAVQQLSRLKRLLRFEADESATPHLESLYSLLKEMLCYRPSERWSARSCLEHDFFRENIRSLLPHKGAPSEPRSSGAGETAVQRLSRASRGTSESCPVICTRVNAHNRSDAGAAPVTRAAAAAEDAASAQEGQEPRGRGAAELDAAAGRHPEPLSVRGAGQSGAEPAGAASDGTAATDPSMLTLLSDDKQAGSLAAHAAVQLARLRGSNTVPSLKSSTNLWHDTTVSQDSGLAREEALKDLRPDSGTKLACIGAPVTVIEDDARTSDLAENVSWPPRF
jgi:Protein kinase domain